METLASQPKRAYLAIKYHADQSNRALIEAVCRALESAGWQTIVVARDLENWGLAAFSPVDLMAASFAEIERCNQVVVEISEKGVGVGIEAGYAFARGIPVLTLARLGSDIPETLRGISQGVIFYADPGELKFA